MHDKNNSKYNTVKLFSSPIEGLVGLAGDPNVAAKARFRVPILKGISLFQPTAQHFPTELPCLIWN